MTESVMRRNLAAMTSIDTSTVADRLLGPPPLGAVARSAAQVSGAVR
jgi:hypothetical protein